MNTGANLSPSLSPQHQSLRSWHVLHSWLIIEGITETFDRLDFEATCKAPDVVLTLTSHFRIRSELEAHQVPPAHDTRTRVAAGFSTTGIQIMNSTRKEIHINRDMRQGIQRHCL